MILRYGRLEKEHVDSLEKWRDMSVWQNSGCYTPKNTALHLMKKILITSFLEKKHRIYARNLKERVREVTIGYVTELLGTFRELGIDFRTTQTVFMGGGAILVSEIIKVVLGTIQRRVFYY